MKGRKPKIERGRDFSPAFLYFGTHVEKSADISAGIVSTYSAGICVTPGAARGHKRYFFYKKFVV